MKKEFKSLVALPAGIGGIVLSFLLAAPQCAAEGAGNSPLMLAPGERLSVVDVAQPGLQYEIVAPAGQALALGSVLDTLGKSGLSGTVSGARKGATTVVIDGSGRVQLKAVTVASPPAADAVFIKSGMIVLDRGKVAIYADQLPQPGRPAGAQPPGNPAIQAASSLVPNLVNGLGSNSAIAATPVAGTSGLNAGAAPQLAGTAPPNYMAQVTVNGVNQGLVDLRTYTLPANANNVTITSTSALTIPTTFAAQNVSNLSIVTPPANPALNTGITLTPLSMAPVGTLSLAGSAGNLSGGGAIVPGKPPVAGSVLSGSGSGSGAIGLTSAQKITPGLPVISGK